MDCILRHIALALALIFVGISANAAVQDYDVKQLPYLTSTGDYTVGSGYRSYIKDYQGNTANCVPYSGTANWRYYYPYGFPIEADSRNDDIRHLYSGKELDRMHQLGWYDFHARTLDPLRGQFTSLDPLCEKYYGYSPYSFCAGNPVNFIDPTGMDWVSAQYENHQFYYFFSNINGMTDFNNTFGEQSNFSYLGKEYSLNINDSSFELLADGNISHNGNMLESEINIDNTFFGSDNFVIRETIGNNYYGNYLGSNNPKLKNGNDAYAIPPIDTTDYIAFLHDQEYDNVGARGVIGAVVNPKAIQADLNLISRFDKNIITNSGNHLYNVGASFVFKALLPIKASFLMFYPLF